MPVLPEFAYYREEHFSNTSAAMAKLRECCETFDKAGYHVVNVSVNTKESPDPMWRGGVNGPLTISAVFMLLRKEV